MASFSESKTKKSSPDFAAPFIPKTSTGVEGNRFTRRITAVNEELNQITAQNTGFDTVTTDFLDFSEDNPFGDPSDM